ncbi:MAG: 16S rRNA (cytidine(1402)-2'-O)-methyltransferase [Kiritimatiellaeota bacterium]|nr:16S rRNA (cytidine(1402)-2'-O)-methyltransferase [Kiritimatiellota bacterium]
MDTTKKTGILRIVSTPIGNLGDITLRALEAIKEADVIAAEDTRRTQRLLAHFELKKKLISCHAYNERSGAVSRIIGYLRNGRNVVALSDAGTPVVSDPGYLLIREAREAGFEPEIIPGVSALTFAVAASGLPADKFSFYGFPPPKSGARQRLLEKIGAEGKTAFLFESPYRIEKLLKDIEKILGADTLIAVIREATKLHEEVIRGTVSAILAEHGERKWKGEFVIGVRPSELEQTKTDKYGRGKCSNTRTAT